MKNIFPLFRMAIRIFGRRLIIFGVIAGLSNTLLILVINESIRKSAAPGDGWSWLPVAFGSILLLYFSLQFFYQRLLIRSSEKMIFDNKIELIDRIRNSTLSSIEKVGTNPLFVLLSYDSNILGQVATLSSTFIISLVMICGALLYLMLMSPAGFLITISIITASLALVLSMQKTNIRRIRQLIEMENAFLRYVRNMLSGMKEMKLDSHINEGIYHRHLLPQLRDIARQRADNSTFQARFGLLGQAIFFVSLGFILFLFPMMHIAVTKTPAQFVITLLYILGPLQNMIPLIPQLSQMKATMERIEHISQQIMVEHAAGPDNTTTAFQSISISDVRYTYPSEDRQHTFSIGPVDLEIEKGDLIFLIGDNGSGKSTFIKVLSGLYPPDDGLIQYNGAPVSKDNLQNYRNLFGVIFTDNHLSEYLYGAENIQESEVDRLIRKMGLEGKVNYSGQSFDTIELSEGQKKRLALISQLLRNRPVYIFDEWAANQDPHFRAFFYQKLLPELHSMGKTVIVITHDDRYLHMAKKVFRMRDGQLEEALVSDSTA